MADVTQVVFIGNPIHTDRIKYLFMRNIPSKVYFLEPAESDDERERQNLKMKSDLEKELPRWVAKNSVHIKMPFLDFSEAFVTLIKILSSEAKEGREVQINVHGGSGLTATAALIAASLTGAKIFWIEPQKWERKKYGEFEWMLPIGAMKEKDISLPIEMSLPKKPDSLIMMYLHRKGGRVKTRLSSMVQEIGLQNLGSNVKKLSSGIVKISKTLGRLKKNGLISTNGLGRGSFEISLTQKKGKIVAELLTVLDKNGILK